MSLLTGFIRWRRIANQLRTAAVLDVLHHRVGIVDGHRLGEEAEHFAAQFDVADVVHPLGVEIDLNKSTFLSEADVHDLFGLDVCVVGGGLCDIV